MRLRKRRLKPRKEDGRYTGRRDSSGAPPNQSLSWQTSTSRTAIETGGKYAQGFVPSGNEETK